MTLALANTIDAIVTAPLNKEAMHLGGYKYPGHTEALAHLCDIGEDDITMLLASPRLRVSHVSTHCSMLEAVASVTTDRVVRVARLTAEAVAPLVNRPPKIALAGINPHAGENGLFGARGRARDPAGRRPAPGRKGIDAYGPIPGDTVFLRALKGEFDAVVAMYHDQGHIPSKLAGFDDTVNITLGLPIIRTSVDHGTAFDIAGTGKAQAVNMEVAIDLAAGMGRARRAGAATLIGAASSSSQILWKDAHYLYISAAHRAPRRRVEGTERVAVEGRESCRHRLNQSVVSRGARFARRSLLVAAAAGLHGSERLFPRQARRRTPRFRRRR